MAIADVVPAPTPWRAGAALAFWCAVAAAAAGCAEQAPRVDFSEAQRHYQPNDYHEVYDRWTRHASVLNGVDKAIEVWATFKSWDYREAYIEHYAAIYSLSDANRAALREAQRDTFHHAYEFHITAQSSEYRWNDLEKGSSAWRVTLVDAAGHELPSDEVKIEKLPDAYESEFFPDRTPFTKTYGVVFNAPASGGDFTGLKSGAITLRIASPIGRVELTWRS